MNIRRFDYGGFLGTIGVWAALGTVLGYLGGRIWFADYAAHLRPLYVYLLVPLSLLFWVRGGRRLAALFLLAALLNGAELARAWWPRALRSSGETTLMVLNVQNLNHRYGATLNLIQREKPDLILLMEYDRRWAAALSSLASDWPHMVVDRRNDSYGIAFFSRYPLRDARIRHPGEGWIPVIDATCVLPSGRVRFIGAHPFPPWGRTATLSRNALLQQLATLVAEGDQPTILAGDLNVTPWSRHFRGLQRGSGLTDAAQGYGWLAGWPARMPAFLRVPKAHVLTGPGVRVDNLRLGPDTGSDHLPLVASFSLQTP